MEISNFHITIKFDKLHGSSAVEPPAKFEEDCFKVLNLNLGALRFH